MKFSKKKKKKQKEMLKAQLFCPTNVQLLLSFVIKKKISEAIIFIFCPSFSYIF
jgi:hypothetical protein